MHRHRHGCTHRPPGLQMRPCCSVKSAVAIARVPDSYADLSRFYDLVMTSELLRLRRRRPHPSVLHRYAQGRIGAGGGQRAGR